MKITMIGHATLLVEVDGKTILTDPWFTEPLYWGQLTHPGDFRAPDTLPPIDLVLVSHGHQDHFDPGALKMIPKNTPVVIFEGYQKTARKAGFQNIFPAKAGTTYSDNGLEVSAMPGKHPGGIATYMIQGQEGKVFFGGDSEYTPELENALKGAKPDVCLMPISGGAVGPVKFHMNAKQAATLVKASGAKVGIPIHYHFQMKTPSLTRFLIRDNSLQEFQNTVAEIAPGVEVAVLDYNETWEG